MVSNTSRKTFDLDSLLSFDNIFSLSKGFLLTTSIMTPRIHRSDWRVGERSNPADCKSAASASQVRILPPPPEILAFMTRKQYKCHRSERSRIFHCIFNKNLSFFDPEFMNIYAHIAQSVEHFLGKEEVTGSSPVMSSRQYIF